MENPTVLSSQTLFDRFGAKILIDTLEHNGRQRPYFYLTSAVEAVATVGVTPDGQLILTRQYRHPLRQVIYDLPAGHLEPGEDPLTGARREFEEETGYYPQRIEKLGNYYQFPGTVRASTTLYFANDLTPTQQRLDEGEELDVVCKPVSEVLEMILNDEFVDGSLQLGVLLALQKGLLPPPHP